MIKTIKLSHELNAINVIYSFKNVINEIKSVDDKIIEIDITEVSFVKPSGISMLHNILNLIKDNDKEYQFKLPKIEQGNEVLKYLDDSLFFKNLTGDKIFENSQVRDTTLPIKNLKISFTEEWIKNNFNLWMARHLDCKTEQLANINSLLLELFNNTRDHSEKDYCCTYSQFYPQKNIIEIGISDIGVGIPKKVKERAPHLQYDFQCIEESLKRGFTTQTNPYNRGEGLYTLKKYIQEEKLGKLTIISGNGQYKLFPTGKNYTNTLKCNYPGTFISIEIDTNSISNILLDNYDEEEGVDLEW
ncbi:hypothetical protein AAA448_06220 [Staphylococcus equorum]|uniref:hypothetical protein n=1 Tax=Staphylococcus equorum TaxID=246432 RepID=UPI003D802F2C